jgi:hypothetical protein
VNVLHREHVTLSAAFKIGEAEEFEVSTISDVAFDAHTVGFGNLLATKQSKHIEGFVFLTSVKLDGLQVLGGETDAVKLIRYRAPLLEPPIRVSRGATVSMAGRYTGLVPPNYPRGPEFGKYGLVLLVLGLAA